MLIEKAMISGYQNVREIRRSQLSNQLRQVFDCVLSGFGKFLLGRQLIDYEWRAVCRKAEISIGSDFLDVLIRHDIFQATDQGWAFGICYTDPQDAPGEPEMPPEMPEAPPE